MRTGLQPEPPDRPAAGQRPEAVGRGVVGVGGGLVGALSPAGGFVHRLRLHRPNDPAARRPWQGPPRGRASRRGPTRDRWPSRPVRGGGPCTGVAPRGFVKPFAEAENPRTQAGRSGHVWARFGHWWAVVIRWPPRRSRKTPRLALPSGLRSGSATHRTRRSGRPVSPLHPPEVRECQPGAGLGPSRQSSLSRRGDVSVRPSPTCTRRWPLRKHAPCYRQRPHRFTRPRLAIALTRAGGQPSRALPFQTARTSTPAPLPCPRPIQRGAAPETLHPALSNWHVRQEP